MELLRRRRKAIIVLGCISTDYAATAAEYIVQVGVLTFLFLLLIPPIVFALFLFLFLPHQT